MPAKPLELSDDQVLWFRARRGHLAGPGAKDPVAAARAILGAQSQQLAPSLLALSARTRGRPGAAKLTRALTVSPRKLVRTWGQRDTLFVLDPRDWADVVAARELWSAGARRGAMPPDALVERAHLVLREADRPLVRSDLFDVLPRAYVRECEEKTKTRGAAAMRLGAGRLLWRLAHAGHVCVADKIGAERSYAAREDWFPRLAWPRANDPLEAAARLARRFLAVFGPATPADVGHFFCARVSEARRWLARFEDELVDVRCGDRKGLVALRADARELVASPPRTIADWPLRLVPTWDSALMAHKDKTWLTPVLADQKEVWRKAAFVAPSVHARGRIVATWSHAERRGALEVRVRPLSGWSARHAPSARREARAVADHLGLAHATLEIDV